MSESTTLKPSRWFYVLAFLIPIFACAITSLWVYGVIPELPGALDTLAIDNLTQVTVPGSAEIHFPKAGAYAVYYENRVVIEGVRYYRDGYPPTINCQLNSKFSGKTIHLTNNHVNGVMYETEDQKRVGYMIKAFSIEDPGIHTFSCGYPDGRSDPKMVLAVGPNFVWEFFNLAVKPMAACLGGGVIFFIASGLSVVIVIITAWKRKQKDKNQDDLEVER
jgi:hypothetical protein